MATTLDPAKQAASLTLSGGNLIATATATDPNGFMALSTSSHNSTRYYLEFKVTTRTGTAGTVGFGFANASQSFVNSHYPGETGNNSVGIFGGGAIWINGASAFATGISFTDNGSFLGCAIDISAKKVWFTSSGSFWNGDVIANQDPVLGVGGFDLSAVTGALFAVVWMSDNGSVEAINFGASSYNFSPPLGYSNWDAAYAAFSIPQRDGQVIGRMVGY